MTNQLAKIAMDSGDYIQLHTLFDQVVVRETATFFDNDASHWLEALHTYQHKLQDPELSPRNLIIMMQASARRRSAIREPRDSKFTKYSSPR